MTMDLSWDEGDTPRSERFGDIYYHPTLGADESRVNFLAGCGLPDAWQRQPGFVIGETGFGTGLNFLVTLEAWRATRPPGHRLHYVSVEGFPLSRLEIERAHRAFPGLAASSQALLGVYPERPLPGFQRFHLDSDGVVLDLLVGEVGEMLGELEARVDAWFLDGFAPDRNPEMWRDEVLGELARLSDIGTRLATFTAAGRVRRSLEHAGFAVHRVPGFAQKRERIVARFDGPTRASALPAWAELFVADGIPSIQGQGIAGLSVARSLSRRGLPFSMNGAANPAQASNVPRALVMPRLSTDESLSARLFSQAFAYARRSYQDLGCWHQTGTLQLVRTEAERSRFQAIADRWDLAAMVESSEAERLAHMPIDREALHVAKAGFVVPDDLLAALRKTLPQTEAEHTTGPTVWAAGAGTLEGPLADLLPLEAFRGQVSLVRSNEVFSKQGAAVIAGKYLSPPLNDLHMIGSTFDRAPSVSRDVAVTADDHARNVKAVSEALTFNSDLFTVADGWAGLRAALPDRLPAVGPAPDPEVFSAHFAGLRTGARIHTLPDPTCQHAVLTGLGARGFTLAPLAAELLVSQWLGEPWPVPRNVALALTPVRFLVRGLRRREA